MSEKTKHAATLAAILMGESAILMREAGAETAHALLGAMPAPTTAAADALSLIRIGRSVSRWAVRACNGEGHKAGYPKRDAAGRHVGTTYSWAWNENDDIAKDKADARTLAKLQAIADRYGAKVKLGGDPRGYVVRLVLASGRTNTMARDGWGVA